LFKNGITYKSGFLAIEVLHLYRLMSNKQNSKDNKKILVRKLAKLKKNIL
jgi:hypothetical protein